jgi:membrane protein DedA with SNARE-associated domain
MLTLGHIQHFLELHAALAYFIIVLGIIVEGEIIVILAGIGIQLGSLNPFFAFIATVIGGGLKSILGYSLGFYLNKHHSHRAFIQKTERRVNYFLPRFSEKPFWSIFISRFLIMGMHSFALVFTGYKKIKLEIFAKAEALSLVSWSFVMLGLGYFFSFTALSYSHKLHKFIGILFVFFTLFFFLEKIVAFMIELFESNKKQEK